MTNLAIVFQAGGIYMCDAILRKKALNLARKLKPSEEFISAFLVRLMKLQHL
jgi:hypothetical protein